ncbi:MAG: hypothetical protein LBT32_01995 [Peptococcaceae bacterium]|jgi:hypothetical protein|nr:hypothetical protein [Peptococcaceae bacterium]
MRSTKLFNAIGLIDDALIREADTARGWKAGKRLWLRWASVAAAACVVLAMTALWLPRDTNDHPDLPKLAVNGMMGASGGSGGMYGVQAYDISDLDTANPWSESAVFETLPVFQNPINYFAGIPQNGLSEDEMQRNAADIAAKMGLTVDALITLPTEQELQLRREKERSVPGNEEYEPDATPVAVEALCGEITIQVDAVNWVVVRFNPGVSLPPEYTVPQFGATEQQANDTLQYLLRRYAAVVDMRSPASALSLSYRPDYDSNEIEQVFYYQAYENSGSLLERILGYNFNQVDFPYFAEDGSLTTIYRYSADLSHKIGDYPVISPQAARQLLLQKHYISFVAPEGFPGEQYIAKVELLYNNNRLEGRYDNQTYMPYYLFWVEMPDQAQANGLKTYAPFYVPAVDAYYLSNMP